ncbi:hypothetical protein DTO169E5_6833 [Paecilomyces variotii]|nr:hypothetical protein DTO169E5_6833 [Paecilomyces variotii]
MSPTLIQHLPLGPLDHLSPPVYPPGSVYFSIKSGVSWEAIFAHLQEGLRRTFLQVPWLNGKLYHQAPDTPGWRPGRLEIRYAPITADAPPPYQLRYNELKQTTSSTYADLKARGFPLDAFADEDLIWVTYRGVDLDAGAEIVAAQANFMPGACLLCVSVLHAACDATGMAIFYKLWADQCRKLASVSGDPALTLPPESWDRTLLDSVWKKERTGHSAQDAGPEPWYAIGLDPPNVEKLSHPGQNGQSSSNAVQHERVMTSKLFYMSPVAFASLRKICTVDVSGNDVLMACIWRGLIKARAAAIAAQGRDVDPNAPFEIQVPVDARPDFSQTMSVPPTYVGNLIYHHRPTLPLRVFVEGTLEGSIAAVAQAIRTSAAMIDHTTMMDGYMLLREMHDYNHIQRPRYATLEGNWLMSSMLMVPGDEASSFGDKFFGNGGRAEGSRPLMSMRNRFKVPACYILPRKRSGGIEFIVSLFEDEWPFLLEGEGFGPYAFLLA